MSRGRVTRTGTTTTTSRRTEEAIMKTTIIISTLLVAASLTAQSRDQERYDVKEPSRVASAALPSLRGLAAKIPAVVGLTADEAATAELGHPLPLLGVRL